MTNLGHNGRFGNSLFQAAFLMGFAHKYNATCEIPHDWIGRKIFKINHPTISRTLPLYKHDQIPTDQEALHSKDGFNFTGYYQYQQALNYYSINKILNWFEFQPWVTERFPHPNINYIACHIRRGDYLKLKHCFCIPTPSSYHDILNRLQLNYPVKWISEEHPLIDKEMEDQGMGFLPDFMQMYYARILLRSNSTFSWWAAALAQNNVLSPIVEDKVGSCDVEFAYGNAPRMADSKNHPGTILTDLNLKYI